MISLLLNIGSVSAGFASMVDTSSMGAFVQPSYTSGAFNQQPMYQPSWSALDTSSMGSFIQQPLLQKSWGALDTSSMGSFTQQPVLQKSWGALDTSSMGSFIQQQPVLQNSWGAMDTSSMGSFIQQPMLQKSWGAMDTSSMGSFNTGAYGYQAMESASATNPYKVNMLNHNIAPLTTQASKVMPVKQIMGGEQHVVDNNLQLHVNHEADKTVLTKRLIHHSPVLHKTIRTHQIAQDVVHDKQVHHMNVVEDRVKQVPGQEYIGTKQQVDHTTANPPATSSIGMKTLPINKLQMYKKF